MAHLIYCDKPEADLQPLLRECLIIIRIFRWILALGEFTVIAH